MGEGCVGWGCGRRVFGLGLGECGCGKEEWGASVGEGSVEEGDGAAWGVCV